MLETFVGVLGTAVLAVIGWAFSLNAKVAVLTQRDEDISNLMNSKLDDIKNRLERIERHVLNGHGKG